MRCNVCGGEIRTGEPFTTERRREIVRGRIGEPSPLPSGHTSGPTTYEHAACNLRQRSHGRTASVMLDMCEDLEAIEQGEAFQPKSREGLSVGARVGKLLAERDALRVVAEAAHAMVDPKTALVMCHHERETDFEPGTGCDCCACEAAQALTDALAKVPT